MADFYFNPSFDLKGKLAHLILVKNPEHNPNGDFGLNSTLVLNEAKQMYTFSGIGYYNPILFDSVGKTPLALAPLLREAIHNKSISAEVYDGNWYDIGTPKRLEDINKAID